MLLLSKFSGSKSRRNSGNERNARSERKDESGCGSELPLGRQPAARVVVFERCGSQEALTARGDAENPPELLASEPAAAGDCGACGGCGSCGGSESCGGGGGCGGCEKNEVSTLAPAGFAHRLSFSLDETTLSDVARRACESSHELSSHHSPDAKARRSSFSFDPPPLVAGEEGAPGNEICEEGSTAGEIGEENTASSQQQAQQQQGEVEEEQQDEAERCRCEKWMAFQQSIAAAEAADNAATAEPATTPGSAATGTTIGDSVDCCAGDSGDCCAANSFGGLQSPALSVAEEAEAPSIATPVAPSVVPLVAPSGATATETLFSRRMKSQSHPAARVAPVLGDTTSGTRNFPFPLARGPASAGLLRNSPLRNFPAPRSSPQNDIFPPPGPAALTAAFLPEPRSARANSTYQYTPPRVSEPFQTGISCSEAFRGASSESPRVTVTSMVTEIAYEPLPEGLFTPLTPLSAASADSAPSAASALFSPGGHSARFFDSPGAFSPRGHRAAFLDSPGASSSASVSSASVLSPGASPGASPSSSPAARTLATRHRRQSSASHATTPPPITSLQGDVPRSPLAPFRRRSHSFASLNSFQLQRKIQASPSPPMSPSHASAASTLAEARAARLSTSAAAAAAAKPGGTRIFASLPLHKPTKFSSPGLQVSPPAVTGFANCATGAADVALAAVAPTAASSSLESHAVAEAGVPQFPRWGSTVNRSTVHGGTVETSTLQGATIKYFTINENAVPYAPNRKPTGSNCMVFPASPKSPQALVGATRGNPGWEMERNGGYFMGGVGEANRGDMAKGWGSTSLGVELGGGGCVRGGAAAMRMRVHQGMSAAKHVHERMRSETAGQVDNLLPACHSNRTGEVGGN
ncbi:unnamed protein product [Closterium sp. Yama58-4]|nr:unnamed protein product [Closterium sp. Yama58-4]